jgi:hypothetical protein
MKILQIIFISATVISGIGMGAVRFGYITNPILYAIIFITLIVSVGGNAVLAYNSLKTRWQKRSTIDPKSATEIMKKALDLDCIAMSDGHYDFRANVFLRCNENKNKICIKYYSSTMEEAADRKMSLEKWQGCAGRVWGYHAPIVADLTIPELQGAASWGLSKEQLDMTVHLGAILSVPIRHPEDKAKTIAILSFDTEEPIANLLTEDHHKNIALQAAAQLGLLLYEFGEIDPL